MKKLSLVSVLLLLAILVLTACGGKGDPNTTTAPSTPSSTESTTESTTPSSTETSTTDSTSGETTPRTEFTFTMNQDNPDIDWTSDVAQEIKKRTGSTIKWDYITGDFRTKMNVWLAAGDYPEVINIHDNTLQSYIKAGAVLDLAPLIKEHAPNIMKAFNNDLSSLQYTDGKIYGLLQPPTQKVVNLKQTGWLSIQAAVLKDAGYPKLTTLDEVNDLVANYIKKYPKIGGGKTIGFSSYGNENQLYNIFDTSARSYAGFPATAQYFIDDQQNARLRFFEPGYTDLFKFFNKINKEGLFDPESLVQTQEQFEIKCNQGRVLVIFGGGGCSQSLTQNDMADRAYLPLDIVAPGKTKLAVKPSTFASRGGDMWLSITKNAKDPVRIIEFYDDMYKLENQILVGWGIEGKYFTVENGKRTVTDWLMNEYANNDSFYEQLGMGYSRPLSTNYASGFTLSDGDFAKFNDSESFITKSLTKVQIETLAKYNATTFSELTIKPTEVDYNFAPSIALWTDEIKKFNADAIAEWGKALQKFILEKDPAKMDGIWDNFQKTLKNKGLDQQNEGVTKLYHDYLATVKK